MFLESRASKLIVAGSSLPIRCRNGLENIALSSALYGLDSLI